MRRLYHFEDEACKRVQYPVIFNQIICDEILMEYMLGLYVK